VKYRTHVERLGYPVGCRFRIGTKADVRKLEWHGEFTDHRHVIEEAFSAQEQGGGLVLIAEIGGFPVGQLWVRFGGAGEPPRLWAFRVMRPYQRSGLGSSLLRFGEQTLAECGFGRCEIGVLKSNRSARRYYERRGYHLAYEQLEHFSFITPAGEPRAGSADQWILQKALSHPVSEIEPASLGQSAS
jgi:GNAT superfamily N-acetyltransferase